MTALRKLAPYLILAAIALAVALVLAFRADSGPAPARVAPSVEGQQSAPDAS